MLYLGKKQKNNKTKQNKVTLKKWLGGRNEIVGPNNSFERTDKERRDDGIR